MDGRDTNKWLQNYLTNRKQYVVIDEHSSGLLDVTFRCRKVCLIC